MGGAGNAIRQPEERRRARMVAERSTADLDTGGMSEKDGASGVTPDHSPSLVPHDAATGRRCAHTRTNHASNTSCRNLDCHHPNINTCLSKQEVLSVGIGAYLSEGKSTLESSSGLKANILTWMVCWLCSCFVVFMTVQAGDGAPSLPGCHWDISLHVTPVPRTGLTQEDVADESYPASEISCNTRTCVCV